MHHYLDYWIVHLATKGPVAVGALILMASVVPARKLARRLPSGRMRLKWNILTALIVFSIACYGTYIYLDHEVRGDITELVVPADRKSTRLNSSHLGISYAVFCLKKKTQNKKYINI